MAKFTGNHTRLYFDTLCRTQKGESVLSLIHATYQAKKNGDSKKEKLYNDCRSALRKYKDFMNFKKISP